MLKLEDFKVNKIEKENLSIKGGANDCICYTRDIGSSTNSDAIINGQYHEL